MERKQFFVISKQVHVKEKNKPVNGGNCNHPFHQIHQYNIIYKKKWHKIKKELTWASRSSLLAFFLSRLALLLALLASNWSKGVFSRAFSALDLWMLSIRTRLFLKTLPFTFIYMSWYMCLSIFLDSRYLRNKRLRTLILLIHKTLVGSLASEYPCAYHNQSAGPSS